MKVLKAWQALSWSTSNYCPHWMFVMRCFYLMAFCYSVNEVFYNWSYILFDEGMHEPVWLTKIFLFLRLEFLLVISFLSQILLSALCFFRPEIGLLRLLFFLSFFVNLATHLSDGKEDIGYHAWLWASFVVALARPPSSHAKEKETSSETYYMMMRALVATPYMLAGFNKLIAGAPFGSYVLSQQLVGRVVKGYSIHPLGEFLLDFPELLAVLYVLGAFFQFFQFFLVFFPRWAMWHGVALILFHVFTHFTLKILFFQMLWLVFVFFFATRVSIPSPSSRRGDLK